MLQFALGWGSDPSDRYDQIARPFRPLFQSIAASAVERENRHVLPFEAVAALKTAGFTRVRLPVAEGGSGVTLPEFFNLLIELSEADPNVTNVLRAHFGFGEDVLWLPLSDWRSYWIDRIADGETAGSGVTEIGEAKQADFSTLLARKGDQFVLNGRKFYTTGSLLADYVNAAAVDEAGERVYLLVPRHAEGVEIVDDWDGFGQQLTASGTATFADVALSDVHVAPNRERFKFGPSFFQVVHLATIAGIGRAAANEVAKLVAERKRSFSHGNAPLPAQDPQILEVVGRVHGAAYAAGAIVLKTAEALERVYQAHLAGDDAEVESANVIAELETAQAVTVVSSLILEATQRLFDALGASSARKGLGLDRHWRNVRTITSHNPRIYKDRIVGDFAVNGTRPPAQWRVGIPDLPAAAE